MDESFRNIAALEAELSREHNRALLWRALAIILFFVVLFLALQLHHQLEAPGYDTTEGFE